MTTNTNSAWRRMGDVARVLGDAVATPRGAAPDRAARAGVRQRKHW
jgi:hypothetical protein